MLDDLFAAACDDSRQEVPPELLARVLSDAETHQPKPASVETSLERRGRWQQFVAVIGGWPSLTGLAAATVAGVWIGFSATTTLLPYGLSSLETFTGQGAETYLTYYTAGEFIEDEDL